MVKSSSEALDILRKDEKTTKRLEEVAKEYNCRISDLEISSSPVLMVAKVDFEKNLISCDYNKFEYFKKNMRKKNHFFFSDESIEDLKNCDNALIDEYERIVNGFSLTKKNYFHSSAISERCHDCQRIYAVYLFCSGTVDDVWGFFYINADTGEIYR